VAPLRNPKHEAFCRHLADGQSPAQAYVAAGYGAKTAYTCGPRLLKRSEVRARVNELQQTVARAAVTRSAINREFVLSELMDNALKAKQNKEWSASNRALELLGKELGLFVSRSEHNFLWSGDLTKLTDEQFDAILQQLEKRIEEAERQEALAAGVGSTVIDIEPASARSAHEPGRGVEAS
jgi:hypothetical protein